MRKTRFQGIYAALATPKDDRGNIDIDALRQLVHDYISGGLHGLYAGGSTAEAFLLSMDERMEIVEAVVSMAKGRVRVIAHVGCMSTRDTVLLARHAEAVGADAVSAVPPFYYQVIEREIVRHYDAIMDAVSLPLLVYHNPAATGVHLPMDFYRAMAGREQTLGVKFTSLNLYEMEQIRRLCGEDFLILCGNDQVLAGGALMAGADGMIGSTVNMMPQHYLDMYDKIRAGDWSALREPQSRANEIIAHLQKFGAIPYVNYILYLQGRAKSFKVREPLTQLSSDEQAAIRSFYERNPILRQHAVG